jgi:predicted RNase H-like HicB family nuclease
VLFPQLSGCATQGDTFEEAMNMAEEALALHLECMEETGEVIPEPVYEGLDTSEYETPLGFQFVAVSVWLPPYRDRVAAKSVKMTVTLPAWLKAAGEASGVNFSSLLQTALRETLGLRVRVRS